MGTRAIFSDNLALRDSSGKLVVASGATVHIYDQGTEDEIGETIFQQDSDHASSALTYTNPLTADSEGHIEFYLGTAARVTLSISKTGYSSETRVVDVAFPYNVALTGYETIAESGVAATQRTTMNFDGDDFDVADDSGNGETDISLSATVPKTDAENSFTEDQIISKEETVILQLRNTAATPASGTMAGRVWFLARNDAGINIVYAEVRGVVDDDADGSEDGWMDLMVQAAGTLTRAFRVGHDGTRPFLSPGGALTVKLMWGTGSPEGVVTAGVGSQFNRTDGGANTTLYIKESGTGNTGWVAK